MAETNSKTEKPNIELFENFLEENNLFADLISENLIDYFEQEKKPEVEFVKIYLESFKNTMKSSGLELQNQFNQLDQETINIIDNHLRNTGIVSMLNSTNAMLKKKNSVLGFLEKILPILEIIKKLITQIIELFPNFLEKLLKKIIMPLLQLIENIIKQILGLFSSKSAARFLKSAERDFLETHIMWRRMQFETLDTTEDK